MVYSRVMNRSRRRIVVVLVLVALVAAATVALALWARGITSTAATGKAQAEAGAKSLASMDATAAIAEFRDARESFASLDRSLSAGWLAGAANSIPWARRQYAAAQALARIGLDGSTAGVELAEVLGGSAPAAGSAPTKGQATAALSSRIAHGGKALTSLSAAASRAETLSADGLIPPLARAVRSIRSALSKATRPLGGRGLALLDLGAYLLDGDHRILIISQDGAELRPTGGWAGSFGIVNVGSSGVKLESYQDVFVLPNPPVRVEPPLGALQGKDFNFRNANWWIDFPTSAEAMLGFWSGARQQPVDGIVMIDTVVMADLLRVLGPVTAPTQKETFTAENLLGRLLYLTQVLKGGQPDRKNVLIELANELEKRLMSASPEELKKVAEVLGKAADAKHIQMYFTDPRAEAAVDALHWSGRVSPPEGTTDVVAISNAMNKPGKVNFAMKKAIDYAVVLRPDRSAETTLTLGYANTGPYHPDLPPDFRDWLRVYRIPGTEFPATRPGGGTTTTMTEFGFPAETRMFNVARGQSHTEVLTARVPGAVRAVPGAQTDGAGQYRLYVLRQADLEDIPTAVSVKAPPGWRISAAKAWLVASDSAVPVRIDGDRVLLTAPLAGDLALDIQLAPR